MKAIQWSIEDIASWKFTPRKYPSIGIKAWKRPKYSPVTSECLGFTSFVESPLHMLTANASMLSPIAVRIISIKPISKFSLFKMGMKKDPSDFSDKSRLLSLGQD